MRTLHAFALASSLTCAACGSSSPTADMGKPDLASRDGGGGGEEDLASSVAPFRYVTDAIKLPKNKMDFARDVNGDAKPENRLGDVVASLKAINYDLQAQEDAAVKSGDALVLFSFRTMDPGLVDDPAASATVYAAESEPAPDFTGKGTFHVDKSVMAAQFSGALSGGAFESADPIKLMSPPTVFLRIMLGEGGSVLLPVVGARLQFTPKDGQLVGCQLNGAVTAKDIDKVLIPGIAKSLDTTLKRMPCDQQCMQVKGFDKNKDGTITAEELRNDFLVQSLLKPDVDLYDAGGKWAPSRDNADPDSLSLGVAFTAVKAKFVE